MCTASLKQWTLFLTHTMDSDIRCKHVSNNDEYQTYNSKECENILRVYLYVMPTVTNGITCFLFIWKAYFKYFIKTPRLNIS